MHQALLQFLVVTLAGWLRRRDQLVIEYLQEQVRVLREQQHGRRPRFTDEQRRRLALRAKALGRAGLRELETVVTPDTLLRWYGKLVAAKYDGSSRRTPGRPRTKATIAELVLKMASENPSWGYTRIRGALSNLGCTIGRSTVKRILTDAGIEPSPARGKRMSWATFLRAHWGAIAATDFFTAEVLTAVGPVRYFVLFVIELKSRRIHIAGIVEQPHGAWTEQVARNLTDTFDGFLTQMGARYLIHDRDPVFTARFDAILKAGGVKPIKLPSRSPNLNAYAERFVLSVRRECLNRVIPIGRRHLQQLVTEYVEHYHLERNHQGLRNELVMPSKTSERSDGRVLRRERLGGLLNFYHREAA